MKYQCTISQHRSRLQCSDQSCVHGLHESQEVRWGVVTQYKISVQNFESAQWKESESEVCTCAPQHEVVEEFPAESLVDTSLFSPGQPGHLPLVVFSRNSIGTPTTRSKKPA